MKKIKIISYMLLTILSCLKFATATEKNQSPIENSCEKTQNNQLEEEKEDEKLVENGASKKEILLENDANNEEILKKEVDKEEILKKDQKYTSDPTYNKLQKISKLAIQKAKKRLEIEDEKKNATTNLIEQISKQLKTINELIKNNRENFNNHRLFSELEELKQNLLDYQKKINTNSNLPKDLENLAKKTYAYIDELSKYVDIIKNSNNDKRIENMYENLRNFAYLDYFAKNHEYNNVANDLYEIVPSIYREVNALERHINDIYDKYVKKNETYKDQEKIFGLKNMKSQIVMFRALLQQYYSEDPRNIIENKDRHETARLIAELCNTFIKSMEKIANRFNLTGIITKINRCPNLTYFTNTQKINIYHYKDVFDRFNVGINYFKRYIDAHDKDMLSTINTTKQKIKEILALVMIGSNARHLYKISSGFITEILDFFKVMSDYFEKNKKIGLPNYLKILYPLQNSITDSKYTTDVRKGKIDSIKKIKSELENLKMIVQQKEKEKNKIKNEFKYISKYESFVEVILAFEKKLNGLMKEMDNAKNFEEISGIRSNLANKCSSFKKKLDSYLENNQIKNLELYNEKFPNLNSYSKFVPYTKINDRISRLKYISENLDTILENFKSLPPKYFPDFLRNNLEKFKSNLNSTIDKIKYGLKYNQYFEELHSFTCTVSGLIKNAIKPLETEQNSEYCSKILNDINNLKRLINSLKKAL